MITAEMTLKKSFQPQVENEPCVMYSCEPIEKGESFSFSTAQDDAKQPRENDHFCLRQPTWCHLEISSGE